MDKRLPVDLGELAALFDAPKGGPVRAFFDRQSGELEFMPRDAEVDEGDANDFREIVASPDRFIEIAPLGVRERLELRRRFVDLEVGDPHLRLKLFEALDAGDAGPRPGGRVEARFESVLRDRREVLDRWLSFRASALETLARTWLSALGVEPR